MQINFYKYQGAGNDFVMIDNRTGNFKNDTKLINWLCDRRFGIGGDGLILLEESSQVEARFKMTYFNADGRQSTMCGNGGRCIVAFAKFLSLIASDCMFVAIDGLHKARIDKNTLVELKMKNVSDIKKYSRDLVLDTGSPHYIKYVDELKNINISKEGASIRYSEDFKKAGINVNFVQISGNKLEIRTYERGVENETLSCGTGVTAAAIAAYHSNRLNNNRVLIKAQGGNLEVKFDKTSTGYENIWLIGPAKQVFKGEMLC